jgi:hypothetical protein
VFYAFDGLESLPVDGVNRSLPIVQELDVSQFSKYFCEDLKPLLTGPSSPAPELGRQIQTQPILHVVYSTGPVAATRGRACTSDDGTGFLLIYVMKRAPTTLAHELGHALTQSPFTGLTLGHPTRDHEGFDAGNLMWSGLEMRQATDRNQIKVGQAIWMHLDERSFLNLARTDPAKPGSPLVRGPPGHYPTQTCGSMFDACPPMRLGQEEAQ